VRANKENRNIGDTRFFILSCIHESLMIYYKLNFQLSQHHKFSIEELENMIPWEREVYVTLLNQHLEELAEKRRQREAT